MADDRRRVYVRPVRTARLVTPSRLIGWETKVRRPARTVQATNLAKALDQIRARIQQCAHELSATSALLESGTASVRSPAVAQALTQNSAVRNRALKCAADLATLNTTLSEGILERTTLQRKLLDSQADLLESQAELSHSQTAEKKARRLAYSDPVTGLPNRILFDDRLHLALVQAKRHAWRVVVMFIDLDKFKNINDAYGHDTGDRVLRGLAQRLQASVRAGDTISRRSGDEFLYLMLEAKEDTDIKNLASKMIATIAEPFEIGKIALTLRASIGIAIYPEDARSAAALLKNADLAMYKAKQSSRGHVLFSELIEADPAQMLVGSVRSASDERVEQSSTA